MTRQLNTTSPGGFTAHKSGDIKPTNYKPSDDQVSIILVDVNVF